MAKRDGSANEAQEKISDYYVEIENEYSSLRDCDGIRRNPTNPFYVTTYDDYGYFSPTVHTARRCYHGKPQQFGQQQFIRGMYRDHSLNM